MRGHEREKTYFSFFTFTLNSHGERIIHLCHTFDLKILNGRTIGVALGNFTHLNANKGESTIDYNKCKETLYKCIGNFIVLPLNEISDHSKIFKSRIKAQNPEKDTYKWNSLKTRVKWNTKNKNKFISVLQNSDEAINDIIQRIEAGLIESTGEKIEKLFINVAETSLERREILKKNWKKRKKSNKNGVMKNAMIQNMKYAVSEDKNMKTRKIPY